MSNFEYVVSSGVWELVYDPSVSGDFSGYAQVVNGSSVGIYIGTSLPESTVVGALVGANPSKISVTTSLGEKIYARRLGNAAQLSLMADAVSDQDSQVLTASVSSASVLFTVDMTSWNSMLLQVTNPGSSCTISYECSNDQVTWAAATIIVSATYTTSVLINTTTTGMTQCQIAKRGKYLRARVSVYGSGTVSVAYSLSTSSVTPAIGAVVWGAVSEGVAASGNPVTIGVECRTATKTAVSSGQVVRPIGTTDGRLVVRPHSVPELEWSYAAAAGGILNTTTAVTIKSNVASLRNYLTSMQIRAEALGSATELAIRDGAGGTVLWRTKISSSGVIDTQFHFECPLRSTANTLLEVVTLTASGTGAVYFNAQGYVAP